MARYEKDDGIGPTGLRDRPRSGRKADGARHLGVACHLPPGNPPEGFPDFLLERCSFGSQRETSRRLPFEIRENSVHERGERFRIRRDTRGPAGVSVGRAIKAFDVSALHGQDQKAVTALEARVLEEG